MTNRIELEFTLHDLTAIGYVLNCWLKINDVTDKSEGTSELLEPILNKIIVLIKAVTDQADAEEAIAKK
jgi:hypothetical protein